MDEYAIEHKQQLHTTCRLSRRRISIWHRATPGTHRSLFSHWCQCAFRSLIKFMVAGHRRVIRTAYTMGVPASEFTIESGTAARGALR